MRPRIVAFGRFWAKFVIGDDWTLAVAVLWGLTFSLLSYQNGLNTWYALPVIAAIMLGISVWYKLPERTVPRKRRFYEFALPVVLVPLIPFIGFRIESDSATTRLLWYPAAIQTIMLIAVASALFWLYRRHPFLATVIAIVVSITIFNALKAPLTNLFQ